MYRYGKTVHPPPWLSGGGLMFTQTWKAGSALCVELIWTWISRLSDALTDSLNLSPQYFQIKLCSGTATILSIQIKNIISRHPSITAANKMSKGVQGLPFILMLFNTLIFFDRAAPHYRGRWQRWCVTHDKLHTAHTASQPTHNLPVPAFSDCICWS